MKQRVSSIDFVRSAVLALAAVAMMGNQAAVADYVATLNTIAGPDRISYWRLGETSGNTANDAWGVGTLDGANVGTYTNVTLGAAGPSSATGHIGFGDTNNAIGFAGSVNQLLRMADSASFEGVGTLTMNLWFNIPSSLASGDTTQRYFGGLSDTTLGASNRYGFAFNSRANQANIRGYAVLNDSDNPGTEVAINSGASGISPNFRDGNWHMLTLTIGDNGNDKEFEIYVDGNSVYSDSLAGFAGEGLVARHTSAATATLSFGFDEGDETGRPFLGLMDEISFVGARLSDAQVESLYASAFAEIAAVPEPSTVAVCGLALMGAIVARRRFQAV